MIVDEANVAIFVAITLAFAIVVSVVAYKTGRNWYAYLVLSLLITPIPGAAWLLLKPIVPNDEGRLLWGKSLIVAVLAPAMALFVLSGLARVIDFRLFEPGFTDADIVAVKASIKAEYEKRPETNVTYVHMLRSSNRKLIGLAKITIGVIEITQSCTATYVERSYIWECK